MNKEYVEFLKNLKNNIVQSRYLTARLVNKEQLLLYFNTGKMLSEKTLKEKWGAKVIEQIAADLQRLLPGIRGFSGSSLKNMRQFFDSYRDMAIGQSVTSQIGQTDAGALLKDSFWGISFTHHMLLINKCQKLEERLFYINQAASQYWSVRVLEHHIAAKLYRKRGKLANNFKATLPQEMNSNALEVFQDEYLFDFVSGDDTDEKVFENELVKNVKNMILTMGKGFCFIGNQYRLEVGGEEFFVDLLFFNRHLRSLVAFELKRGKFKPGYAGQLNFYLNVLDEKVRTAHENASIGIVLCKEKNNTVVEFAVRTIDKAMGVATYRTTREMPAEMQGILPDTGALAQLL
jgi:predicted nuclease of restriction endonuclease-like (RecB) superfamily